MEAVLSPMKKRRPVVDNGIGFGLGVSSVGLDIEWLSQWNRNGMVVVWLR
jgi:hypothetical protein